MMAQAEYVPLHDVLVYVIPAIIASAAAIAAAILSSKNKTRMEELKSQADTGNGRSIGQTVHDTDQTVELLAAMMHTNTKEVVELSNKLDAHAEKLDAHIEWVTGLLTEATEGKEKVDG